MQSFIHHLHFLPSKQNHGAKVLDELMETPSLRDDGAAFPGQHGATPPNWDIR